MTSTRTLVGLIFSGVSVFASANEICPAINCDCAAFTQENWRSICEVHERAIKQECSSNGNQPQNYCRLQGPAAKPVAVSVSANDLEALPTSASPEAVKALRSQAHTSQWSLTEDMKSATHYLQDSDLDLLYQTVKILETNAGNLFQLEREVINGLLLTDEQKQAGALASDYDDAWRLLASQLESLSDSILAKPNQEAANKKRQQLAYKVARLAATTLEYSGHLLAQADVQGQAALSWQLAASVAEQLVTRSNSEGAGDKYVKFYREQASARWHRATYHWLLDSKPEESQISFQNAGQVLLTVPVANVAGTDSASVE